MIGHALLIRKVIGPLWAWWEGSPYLRHYRYLRRTQFDAPETIRTRQWAALQSILHHGYETVPFYRGRFDAAGIHPSELRDLDDYSAIPVLTKADIRAHAVELLSDRYAERKLHRKRTSGSTGVSLEILVDDAAMHWKRAFTLRADEWSGWRFGEPVARLWGNPEYVRAGWRGRVRNGLLDRAVYLDTLRMDEESIAEFVRGLRRTAPALLFGHAHSVYLLAEYLHSRGPGGIQPRGIITTAMVLHDWERRRIEAVFDCPVTNRYGCEEVSLIACECERHGGLHVNSDGVYVELLRDGRPVAPGEPGAVVVTDLTNRAMPLIRYQVGDVAVWTAPSDRSCSCGRGMPRLERIEGREADFVVTPSGALISGISLTENFAVLVPGVAQLQIIQDSVHQMRFRLVRGPEFGPSSLERLTALVRERLGANVQYECEYVERIPQEPSGKYRFCISNVPNPFTRLREAAAA